jgi:imidazolonepropionase-like amidohydrolase
MRRHCGIVLLLILLASCSPAGAGPIRQPSSTATVTASSATATTKPASAPLSPALALVNGTIIDGTGATPVQNAVLIIQDGRIIATGSRNAVTVPERAQVI